MTDHQAPERFWDLLEAALSGTASAEMLDELETLLADEPRFRRLYLEHVQLCVDLRAYDRRGRAQEALQVHMQQDAVPRPALGARPNPAPASPASATSKLLLAPIRSLARDFVREPVALALLLLVMLSGGALMWKLSTLPSENGASQVSQNDEPPAPGGDSAGRDALTAPASVEPGRTAQTPPGSDAPGSPDAKSATTVARLARTIDVKWDGTAWQPGTELRAGQRFVLKEGLAEIAFDSGAKVIVEGPAEFEVGGRRSKVGGNAAGRTAISHSPFPIPHLSLSLGKLVARVPAAAVGFTVQTPSLTIVDLGTEFAVEVGSRKSEGGGNAEVGMRNAEGKPSIPHSAFPIPHSSRATTVHVLQGEVSVQPVAELLAQVPASDLRPPTLLKAGEAITSGPAGKSPHRIPPEAARFIRRMPAAAVGDGLAGSAPELGGGAPGASDRRLMPGDILAVTRHTYKLLKIDPLTGKQTRLYEDQPHPLAGHWMCVLADAEGNVWIGAQGASQPGGALLKFDHRAGKMKRMASGGILTAGNFHSMAAGPDETLYGALEDADDQIVIIDSRSGTVKKLVSWGNNIWGIAVDRDGHSLIAVSDYLGEVVQIRDGRIIPWTEKSGAEGCRGVVVRPDGRVFVSATNHQRCRILEVDRNPSHMVTEIVSIPQEPNHFFSMFAVEADGRLIVSETGEQSRIHRIDVDAKSIVPLATGGELEEVYGIAVVPGGPAGKKSHVEHGN